MERIVLRCPERCFGMERVHEERVIVITWDPSGGYIRYCVDVMGRGAGSVLIMTYQRATYSSA